MRGVSFPSVLLTILFILAPCLARAQEDQSYAGASWETLQARPYPEWFLNAKLGVFVHWGVYSVPAYSGPEDYAEWFLRGLQLGDTLRTRFMRENYGEDFRYREFAPLFRAELFQPREWAEIFSRSGARYVVLVSKHHDGYALWPSRFSPGWNSVEVGPGRDLVGELTEAVRGTGLRMGLYYSLGEWTHPLYRWSTDPPDRAEAYVREHMAPQFKELVSTYRPSLIFSDGDWGNTWQDWGSRELIGWYFDTVGPEAVVNDRWGAGSDIGFKTPEYSAGLGLGQRPWVEVRGLGRSFAFNRNEPLEAYLTPAELIHAFARAVAAGGGMILNVGPRADGQIPLLQQERLLQLGNWLETNGEAIYGAKAWIRSSDSRELVLRRVDPAIDFDWVRNGPGRPIREDDFSATWTGVLIPDYSEPYTIEGEADDSIQVWIGDQALSEAGSTISLRAGEAYPIRVEYRELDVAARARLFWSSPTQPREIIPGKNLRTGVGPEAVPGIQATYRSRQEWVVYTRKGDALYAIFFQWPEDHLILPIPPPGPRGQIALLGGPDDLPWEPRDGALAVDLTQVRGPRIPGQWAWTLKIQDDPGS